VKITVGESYQKSKKRKNIVIKTKPLTKVFNKRQKLEKVMRRQNFFWIWKKTEVFCRSLPLFNIFCFLLINLDRFTCRAVKGNYKVTLCGLVLLLADVVPAAHNLEKQRFSQFHRIKEPIPIPVHIESFSSNVCINLIVLCCDDSRCSWHSTNRASWWYMRHLNTPIHWDLGPGEPSSTNIDVRTFGSPWVLSWH
jgi:hypothetical protein